MAANAYEKVPECESKAEHKNEAAGVDWGSMIQLEIANYMQYQNPTANEANCTNFIGYAGKNPTYYSSSRHGKDCGPSD
ncbi:hypothetical protein GH714_002561 [Hevea brasiliensis]|uniref:Uncharacterized protein n=1 Tax=Hevea brasiliensis TaxID=3981 RepID=A0A6A6KFR0_HEVBR|nr:hypothetical protein GH714_002445 [Hevea brasiliensis]KAF2287740.1 hypothetical protein GH714_002521 [Hevea brasiliensis]KAF2287750.1 hypothetical protein GH714_002561 [Hevea brasiliensis]